MEAVSSAEPEGAGGELQPPPGGQGRRAASALRFSHLPHMRSGHQENLTFTCLFRLRQTNCFTTTIPLKTSVRVDNLSFPYTMLLTFSAKMHFYCVSASSLLCC